MCIISGPVLSVNSTKILVLPSKNGRRQLTVYRNAVATPDSNAMCLPVPNPHSVKFETVPKDIFTQCSQSFARKELTLSARSWSGNTRSALPILSHGSYEVVLVPSMNDCDRIPSSFTTLTEDVIAFLQRSYPAEFGIVLCRLKKGNSDYEPFAYSHDIQANGNLFAPTKHYHVGDSNQNTFVDQTNNSGGWQSMFGQSLTGAPMMSSGSMSRYIPDPIFVNHKVADDWDHELYSAYTDPREHDSKTKQLHYQNAIRWSEMPADYQYGNTISMRCKEIVGEYPNKDIQMTIVA